jgi:hypothetical protein
LFADPAEAEGCQPPFLVLKDLKRFAADTITSLSAIVVRILKRAWRTR